MCRIYRLLRVSVQAYRKLSLDRCLKCVTLADYRLVAHDIQDAGQRDIVPVHIEEHLIQICNQVLVNYLLLRLLAIKMKILVAAIIVDEPLGGVSIVLSEALLGNVSVVRLFLHDSLSLEPEANGLEHFILLVHIHIFVL